MSDVLLRCERLEVGYAGKALLPPIDLTVEAGSFLAVVGRNGSGKSTLFRTVLGLLPAVGGAVSWPCGTADRAYVGQRRAFDDLYPLSVGAVVRHGRLGRGRWLGWRGRGDRPVARRALEALEVAELEGRTFRSLSEGQKQRVLLARLVASEARIAFLDEPTAAMDAVAEAEAMDQLERLRTEFGMAVVVISHHLAAVATRADRVLFLDPDCQEVVSGTAREVFDHELFVHRYGEAHSGEHLTAVGHHHHAGCDHD